MKSRDIGWASAHTAKSEAGGLKPTLWVAGRSRMANDFPKPRLVHHAIGLVPFALTHVTF